MSYYFKTWNSWPPGAANDDARVAWLDTVDIVLAVLNLCWLRNTEFCKVLFHLSEASRRRVNHITWQRNERCVRGVGNEDLEVRQTFIPSFGAWNVWQVVTCWKRFVQTRTKPCFKLLASCERSERERARRKNQRWKDKRWVWLTYQFLLEQSRRECKIDPTKVVLCTQHICRVPHVRKKLPQL